MSDVKKYFKVISLDITDSTNNEAKRIIKDGETAPFIIIANEQTSGRGRQGKSFFSPRDTGLYMTVSFPIKKEAKDFLYLTSAAAVSVVEAIYNLTGEICGIKWVNDIYKDGKKICGILTESVMGENSHVIIGIGVNLTTASFPEEISRIAASLDCPSVTSKALAEEISTKLRFYFESGASSFIDLYRKYSIVLSKDITYIKNGETRFGRVLSITDSGALLVKREDGEEEILDSGEISLRLK